MFNETEWSNSAEVIFSSLTFSELMETIIGKAEEVIPGRPKFAGFAVPAKAVTIRVMLQSLFRRQFLRPRDLC